MADTPDDENDKTETDEEGKSSGKAQGGSAGGGAKPPVDTQEHDAAEELAAKRKKTEGEGDGAAAAGTAFVRASGDGVIAKLSTDKQKTVWGDFRHLDFNQVVVAVAEFFNEFPSRASANLAVAWDKGGFAIVNLAIKFGQDVAMAVRERTRESAVSVRRKYGINIKAARRAGVSPTAPNPQAGLT